MAKVFSFIKSETIIVFKVLKMIIKQLSFTLKDGREAVIRSPQVEDWKELIAYLTQAASETDFLLTTPEECSKYSEKYEKAFIEATNNSDNAVMLMCLIDHKIVGTSRIEWKTHIKTKHRARIGIAILKDYWGLGIGSTFFKEMIRIALENKDLLQLELEFVDGNERAKALYEKFGFKIFGFIPNSIRAKDGSLRKEYMMIKELDR